MNERRIAADGVRHVFVHDMVLAASIGVYPHEHAAAQRIRVNVDLAVAEPAAASARPVVGRDELGRVLDYEAVVRQVRDVVGAGHVQLVETLAERIAEVCLGDERVREVFVRVEKLDVFVDVAAVGVEIRRGGANLSTAGN